MCSPCDLPTQLSLVSMQVLVAAVTVVGILPLVAILSIVAIVDNGGHGFPL